MEITLKYVFYILLVAFTVSCGENLSEENENSDKINDKDNVSEDSLKYNPTWTFTSHGKAKQDYNVIFPQDSVYKLEIVMTPAQWVAIRNNMKSIVGYDFGARSGAGGKLTDTETGYVDVLLSFRGKVWKNTGYRLKGNSSLNQAWGEGNYKLPFRLNFDKFEDTYPATTNQHFYGFKELSFSPGFKDQSLMREKTTADIFRMAGIPAARTAFYRVYVDFGSGLRYCGVYTAVELPDDNMIKDQFGEESGNIYKPESKLSAFLIAEFDKKNNENEADYSDVKNFIAALNSSLRSSDPSQWRKNLEATFNVDHFIKYLAVNNAIVNWDSYGNMAHNYYLYNHSVKKLTWIPWDHNEALSGSPGITGTSGGPGPGSPGTGNNGLSLSMNEVTAIWPLIRYIADDPVYSATYKSYLKWFNDNILIESNIASLLDRYFGMISPYVIGVNGETAKYTYLTSGSSFTGSLSALKTHVSNRKALISAYVN
jgi:spore coat protein H